MTGPRPDQLFVPVARDLLCRALIAELQWHQHALTQPAGGPSGENTVLNAARSVHAAETGEILSKTNGGQWWLRRHPSDPLVPQALARRANPQTAPLDWDQVSAFLVQAVNRIADLQR